MRENGKPRDSLLPNPGQNNTYRPKFHPLPGDWAKEQLANPSRSSQATRGSGTYSKPPTDLQRALASEKQRIEESMRQQGITPGKAIYEDPRQSQNTLLPTEKYASG
jgi:hypothetical protein